MALFKQVALLGLGLFAPGSHAKAYNNPILPGWNSDPSCTFVKELDATFFCTTSSFLAFPGVPVYASKDLVNWKLASNALTRPEQLPELSFNGQKSEGIWASTIRYRKGNGTGDRNPEGPHIYDKDGFYYLLIGEGGTETNHTVTIARSKSLQGPYEGYDGNPILTAKNTDEYFQTVGHADLFQDASGNWWAVALATRCGPKWETYPMGRESVVVPVKWEKDEWPVLDTVRGKMSGPLPERNRNVPGDGHWVNEHDRIDFSPGSSLPKHLSFWRPPKESLFAVSPKGYPNTLRISPSRANLTADTSFEPKNDGLGFVFRKQSSTILAYSVDVLFDPSEPEEEAGITIF
ncbi:hypothetical protein QQZ08_011686 [Neonectria magnoliae]|uniref:Beta-xylosidase C-terminal Concanavalin A-like domain-containing protein n=1 Tax=Neonectria magnoliae TaxID=2732573 RepID=A0ABR1H858_9HYPO